MRSMPEIWNDCRDALGEEAEQAPHEVAREERHVARGDEDGAVRGGEEASLDTRERSLSRAQIGDLAGSSGYLASGVYDKDLRAAGREGGVDPVEDGIVADLEGELVSAHPAAPSASQDHAGRLGVAHGAVAGLARSGSLNRAMRLLRISALCCC